MQAIFKKIEQEIDNYINQQVSLGDGIDYSQYALVNRLERCRNQVYPGGRIDSTQTYKYWFDITQPRILAEVKNIDFDTKDIKATTETPLSDRLAIFLLNLFLSLRLDKTRVGEIINSDIEEFSDMGNVVWKKTKGGYERAELKSFYVLNQTAKTLDDSDVIERHLLNQSDLRAKEGVWENIDEVIKNCGNRMFSPTEEATPVEMSSPIYEIYERNGEVSEKELLESQGKTGGDESKYVLAKIIVAGLKKGDSKSKRFVLFADEITEKPYKEAHRGAYKGRWLREGLREILMDCQTRANQIGNQISRGLEWAAKTIFRTNEPRQRFLAQNVTSDLRTGTIVRAQDFAQVDVRLHNLDQLIADYNRIIRLADDLANSHEIVMGESMPSRMPFRLGALINQNANKLFDFLREKLALALGDLIQDWILPDVMREIRTKKIIDLTSAAHLEEYYQMLAQTWYVRNLLSFPPHSTQEAEMLVLLKIDELKRKGGAVLKVEDDFWKNFKPKIKIVISGENVNLMAELESLYSFIALEQDPVRRTAMIEMAMARKNIDITQLPKSPPMVRPEQMPAGTTVAGQQAMAGREPTGRALATPM